MSIDIDPCFAVAKIGTDLYYGQHWRSRLRESVESPNSDATLPLKHLILVQKQISIDQFFSKQPQK